MEQRDVDSSQALKTITRSSAHDTAPNLTKQESCTWDGPGPGKPWPPSLALKTACMSPSALSVSRFVELSASLYPCARSTTWYSTSSCVLRSLKTRFKQSRDKG